MQSQIGRWRQGLLLAQHDKHGSIPAQRGAHTSQLHLSLLLPDVHIHAQAHACDTPACRHWPDAAGCKAQALEPLLHGLAVDISQAGEASSKQRMG